MAPRKPLAPVSANAPLLSRAQAAKTKATLKEDNIKEDTDAMKAQIADLTSQLANSKLDPSCTAPASNEPKKNPFGGAFPSVSPYLPAGVSHPKRAVTAFQLFCKEKRQEVKDSNPNADLQEINGMLSDMWKKTPSEEMVAYEQDVNEDRARYGREMEAFNVYKTQAETERLAMEYWSRELKQKMAMEFYEAHLAKTKSIERKGPEPPKQARTAYNFYSAIRHKDISRENMSLGEASAKVAEDWQSVQASRAKKNKAIVLKMKKLASEDETRYEKELKEYEVLLAEIAEADQKEKDDFKSAALEAYAQKQQDEHDAKAYRKLISERKEIAKQEKKKLREEKREAKAAKADEPKRPRSAYAYYFGKHASAVAEYVRTNNVEHSMAKEVADRWKALSDKEKRPFEKEAEKDRDRYTKEMNGYVAQKAEKASMDIS